MDFEKILQYAIDNEASDIHISPGLQISFRIHGDLTPFGNVINGAEIHRISLNVLNQRQQEDLEKNRTADFVYNAESNHRFRGNAYYTRNGLALALRLIPSEIPDFDTLGLPHFLLEDIMKLKQGLILVVGPTGHGKSTTLASVLKHRSNLFSDHIITLEDPIEFIINSKKGVVHQRSQGRDVNSFDEGLRSALREDPDVLMVGEMRDLETISSALKAAETGHLVLSTLHTGNAAETINRIIDVFPSDQQAQVRMQLAGSLTGVISQRLMAGSDGKRVLAYEIMFSNYAIKNHIRKGTVFQIPNAMQTDNTGKMLMFDQSLANLVLKGKINFDIALENAFSKEQLTYILNINGYEEGLNMGIEKKASNNDEDLNDLVL